MPLGRREPDWRQRGQRVATMPRLQDCRPRSMLEEVGWERAPERICRIRRSWAAGLLLVGSYRCERHTLILFEQAGGGHDDRPCRQ